MEHTLVYSRSDQKCTWGPQEEDILDINSSPDRRSAASAVLTNPMQNTCNDTIGGHYYYNQQHCANTILDEQQTQCMDKPESIGTLMSPLDPISMMTDLNDQSHGWSCQTSSSSYPYHHSLVTKLQQQAGMEAEQRMQKIKMNNARFGSMRRVDNHGPGRKYRYQFHDGTDYKRNKDQLVVYQSQLKDIESELTMLRRPHQKHSIDHDYLQQLYEARRTTQLNIDLLGREKQFLAKERAHHIQASYAMLQEGESPFQHRPLLAHRYVLFNLLGRGGFCEVWRVYDLQEQTYFAAKIHRNYHQANEEHRIQSQLKHPNIVQVYGNLIVGRGDFANYFVIIMELVESSLATLLKTNGRLGETEAQNIVSQIMEALRYLNEADYSANRLVHYDLKPENVLMTDSGRVKIADFGLSKFTQFNVQMPGISGTYFYLPPECFMTNRALTVSSKIDVWAVGVIFYQLLFGIRPFGQGMTQQEILKSKTMLYATSVQYPDSAISNQVSEGSKTFIEKCLTFDVHQRLSVREHFGMRE